MPLDLVSFKLFLLFIMLQVIRIQMPVPWSCMKLWTVLVSSLLDMVFISLNIFWHPLYREMDYDGIVLESWSRWANYGVLHNPEMRKMVCLPPQILSFLVYEGYTTLSISDTISAFLLGQFSPFLD